MSIAKHAQASRIMSKASNGHYVKQFKFADYGSVVEDCIMAQQREADERLKEIQFARLKKVGNNA